MYCKSLTDLSTLSKLNTVQMQHIICPDVVRNCSLFRFPVVFVTHMVTTSKVHFLFYTQVIKLTSQDYILHFKTATLFLN